MPKKSVIAVLCSIALVIVASLTLVFTVGPLVSADSEPVLVPTEYLNIHDGVLGDGSVGGAFTAEGKNFIQNLSTYRVEIPEGSVTSIGGRAFYKCYSLTSITIPDSVTSIGDAAFWKCSLTSITLGNSVESIGDNAFGYCDSLTSITIPDSVTSIGNDAFFHCYGLTRIMIPDSVTSIGEGAFFYCYNLTSITLGNSVESIGDNAFYDCDSLTSITIPASVTSIGEGAFEGCHSLTSITIPASVTSIGSDAFAHCTNLTTIYCEVESQPAGWDPDWKNNCGAKVVWGYKIHEPETAGTENAWIVWVIGGAIAALVVTGATSGVVIAKKRRKH